MAQITASPAVSSGGTTMDGSMANGYATTWAGVRSTVQGDGVGNTWAPTTTPIYIRALYNASGYYAHRLGLTFDTSAIGAGSTITSATLRLFGTATNYVNANSTSAEIVEFAPVNAGTFDDDDWTTVVYTALATGIAFASLSQTAYNDFTLNATGLTKISKTGITKLLVMTGLDLSNTAPAASGNDNIFSFVATDGADKPQLVVNYTTATGSPAFLAFM